MNHRATFVIPALLLALCSFAEAAPSVDRPLPSPDIRFRGRHGGMRDGVRCAADAVRPARANGAPPAAAGLTAGAGAATRIPVAFHVVYSRKRGVDVGNVPLANIEAQVDVLNDAYAGTGFTFFLASVDRTLNNKWFTGCYSLGNEQAMKQALAVDPATTLNVYTCQPNGGILGYAYYPSDYPEDSYWHGVVAQHSSLPGGGAAPYDEGDTATHEVGHYLGLAHTFENGCTAPGDEVGDTPYEAEPAYGCPVGRDTCLAPGLDPITNFMDYTEDACMVEFTGGQADRMVAQVAAYRPTLGSTPAGCGDGSCGAGEACACVTDCGAPPAVESSCSGGVDDDCDGKVDCADPDCASSASCGSCLATGASCSSDSQCCSARCKGKPGARSCG